jgi:hypothetical protein
MAAPASKVGFRLYCWMIRWISASERIPDAFVHDPAVPPAAKGHPGVLQEGLERVNDRP